VAIISFHLTRTHYCAYRFRVQGEKYVQEQNFEKAIDSFKKAIYLNPRPPDGYIALARTYIQLNKPSAAVDELLKANKFNPEDKNVLNLLKEAYQMELKKSSPILKIGIHSEELTPLTTVEATQSMLHYLSRNLNQKISLTIISKHTSMVRFLVGGKVNMAIVGPEELTGIENRSEIIPLGLISLYKRNVQRRIIILARKGLIRTVKDLRGGRVAFGDKESLTGYILPRVLLLQYGIDPEKNLKEVYFMKSQEEILTNVVKGNVDAGVLNEQVFCYLSSIEHLSQKVHIIAYSSEIPANVLLVNREISPELIQRIKTILINYTRTFPDKLKFSPFNGNVFQEYIDSSVDNTVGKRKRVYTLILTEF